MELVRTWLKRSPLRPNHVQLVGQVAYNSGPSEELWFEVPAVCERHLSHTGNPWLMALMPLAFHRGEALRLPLPVDATLLTHTHELLDLWAGWFPEQRPIRLEVEGEAPATWGDRIGTCFSGGIDSCYSFLHHEPTLTPGATPTDDLLCIWGCGIRVDQSRSFESVQHRLANLAAIFNRRLLCPATNLRETQYGKLPWGPLGHGPALAAVALALENRYRLIRIPASFQDQKKFHWGTHPESIPRFATAGVAFENDGGTATRTQKTEFLTRCPEALASLHVCWQDHSDRNCGRCEKCLRTMITLELLGQLKYCPAFPPMALTPERIAKIYVPTYGTDVMIAEVADYARELGRHDIAQAIDQARQRSLWLRRVGQFGQQQPPRHRLGRALSKRFTRLLVAATGSLGRV